MQSPDNVCVLSSSYPSPAAPARGAFVEDIALGLSVSAKVTVVAPLIYPEDPKREDRGGVQVVRFGFGSSGKLLKEFGGTPMFLMMRYMVSGVFACLRAARGGVIFAHWVVPAGVIGAACSFMTRRPLVLYAHGSDICVYAEKSTLYRTLTRWVLGRASGVFAVSQEIETRLIERFNVPASSIHRVACGVDIQVFHAPKKALAHKRGPVRFLFVGDMVPAKGVPELIEATTTLLEAGHALTLDMVGDGPLREPLAAQVEKAGVATSIHFHGALSRAHVAEHMRGSNCLILPSHNEGTPVCIMEALTSGTPVIATRVGGIPDLITEEENGLLIASKDVGALTASMMRLIDDRPLLTTLTRSARTTGDRFSLPARVAEVRRGLAAMVG